MKRKLSDEIRIAVYGNWHGFLLAALVAGIVSGSFVGWLIWG